MGGCKSTPGIKQEHLDAFGPDLGPIYDALYNEVLWLHTKWLEYRKLYEKSERVAILNESAPFFFNVAQGVIWEDVLLHIARLTDPAKQRQFENLSLPCLPPVVPDRKLAQEVRSLVAAAVKKAAFARKYRDKHLAHRDLDHALDRVAVPLSAGSRQNVEDVLGSFADVLNHINSAYGRPYVAFRDVWVTNGDARSLLHTLALANQVEAERRKRMSDGTYSAEDFAYPSVP